MVVEWVSIFCHRNLGEKEAEVKQENKVFVQQDSVVNPSGKWEFPFLWTVPRKFKIGSIEHFLTN